MEWRHYEVRASGATLIEDGGRPIAATYEMGIVSTGRSRVFAGHFVRIILPSGTGLSGEDEHSLRAALRKLAFHLSIVNLQLRCAGLDTRFEESGLSIDTGYGYASFDDGAIHMMDPPPVFKSTEEQDIDGIIREAIDGMRIGGK